MFELYLGTGFVMFDGLCFFEFLTPSSLGASNFLNSNLLLAFFSVPDAPVRVQVWFEHLN
jgi:hypothetical protein